MWWIIGLIIAGIVGIANAILESLRKEVAVERQRWETTYHQVEAQVRQYQQLLDEQLYTAQYTYEFSKLTNLHHASMRVADATHTLFDDARRTLDAMGRAIVSAAQQRKQLEQRKRGAWFWETGRLESEIQSLHKLRDEILVPDKDKVKSERDHLLQEIRQLNQQTAALRDLIRDRCGPQGVAWYNALVERTQVRQLNRERAKKGLAPLPVPSSNKPRQLETRVQGTVKWYDASRGFGFITVDGSGQEVHVGQKNLQGVTSLQQGDRVAFVIRQGNKGPWAAKVAKCTGSRW